MSNYAHAHKLSMQAAKQVLMANKRVGSILSYINDVEGHTVIVAMFKRALTN